MCELAVRVVDQGAVGRTERGHVIAIQPDDWAWSAAEQSGAEWEIVKLPGVSVESMQWLLDPPTNGSTVSRLIKFDVDAWQLSGRPDMTDMYVPCMCRSNAVKSYLAQRLATHERVMRRRS